MKAIVYPNPASSSFNMWLPQRGNKQTKVIVTSAEGKQLYKTEGKKEHFVFSQNFTDGLFIVTIIQGSDVETIKVVKT